MPTKKYRVAVVGGAGTWGRRYLRAYANHPDCEIVALVDRAWDRRQAFADRYGIRVVYDTLDDLLA
ncbi:MAG: Gfo/Idh/MocA family oxidoreductase, partial [Candidatus Poribacteria bacterium]|nr:Gfo/Idh/MocA family oxidoreductase [Candidatus Poribacteria bacterium]